MTLKLQGVRPRVIFTIIIPFRGRSWDVIIRFRPRQHWRARGVGGAGDRLRTSRLVHLRHGREFKQFTFHAYRWPDFYDNWMDPAKNAHWAYGIYSEQG